MLHAQKFEGLFLDHRRGRVSGEGGGGFAFGRQGVAGERGEIAQQGAETVQRQAVRRQGPSIWQTAATD